MQSPTHMGDEVFVNGRSAIHAGSAGQTMAFPDVNLCPPAPPAGPIPTPLPNVALGADLQGGASSVLIEGNPMGKQSSFLAKSTGNEVAQSTGGGVVSHVVQGKAYFVSYSLDVTCEGEEVPRHLDMMTHNHAAQSPPNAAMGTYLAAMDLAVIPPASDPPKTPKEDKPQPIEIFFDPIQNSPTGGVQSLQLVSDDAVYDTTLPASAATPKGGLLCVRFEKVLPNKFYSLYLIFGQEKVVFFEHVPFREIAIHTPGDEKLAPSPAAEDSTPAPSASSDDDPDAQAELPAHPDDWYDPRPWTGK